MPPHRSPLLLHRAALLLCAFLMTAPSSLQAAATSPASSLDDAGNIQFKFNDESSVKIAKAGNSATSEECDEKSEGAIRYNKHSAMKALEYCDGEYWISTKAGATTSLAMTQTGFITGKTIGLVHDFDKIIRQGTFTKDGYIGAYIMCGGGTNRMSAFLSIGDTVNRVASATAHDAGGAVDNFEIDHSSFFSYVPANTNWYVSIRENVGNAANSIYSNCLINITKFGD